MFFFPQNKAWHFIQILSSERKDLIASLLKYLATDKTFFKTKNLIFFLISPWKHMLWVLIRSASPRHFWWVPTTYVFLWRNKKNIHSANPLIQSYYDWGILDIPFVLEKKERVTVNKLDPLNPKTHKIRMKILWTRSWQYAAISNLISVLIKFSVIYKRSAKRCTISAILLLISSARVKDSASCDNNSTSVFTRTRLRVWKHLNFCPVSTAINFQNTHAVRIAC